MNCVEFLAGRCNSCNQLAVPYAARLTQKQQQLALLLAPFAEAELLPAVASEEQGFRTKAKMVVSGTERSACAGDPEWPGPRRFISLPFIPSSLCACFCFD